MPVATNPVWVDNEYHPPTNPSPLGSLLWDDQKNYDHSFWTGALTYISLGALNLPGGAGSVPIRNAAVRRGLGGRAALAIGLGGEWALVFLVVGVAGAVLDPLDLYHGGLIPDKIAQATTLRAAEGIADAKNPPPLNFMMDNWGAFQ